VGLLAVGLLIGVVAVAAVGYWKMSASSEITDTQPQPRRDEQREAWTSPTPLVSPTPRTSASVVGSWRTNVTENGQAMEITVTFSSDGDTRYRFKDARGRTANDAGTWQYSDGILFERFSNGASGKSSIRWIDDNTVELTIIDNGVPAYAGLKRTYRRVN
jgi:serine/threonine-protein kinase